MGGEAGHQRMCRALGAHGLDQVLDVVPNHMAIAGRRNHWWWDVLENGLSSRFATYFDIAWDPPEWKLKDTILVPVLGDHYGRVLEAGQLQLAREDVRLLVRYHEHEFPIDARSYDRVLGDGFDDLAPAFAGLPVITPSDRAGALRRHVEKEGLLDRLRSLDPGPELDARIAAINAEPDRLDALLERQNYRLARWQTAGFELDYRRFFDVSSLVALRMEDPDVFVDTHVRVIEWAQSGVLDGVRIDHPDGLRDPLGYLTRLRATAPNAWIVVEKVLQPAEELPEGWPVAGTTGYDFMNRALGLFVDPAGEEPLTRAYADFTGDQADFAEVAYQGKHRVMRELLAADLRRLEQLFVRVCEGNRRYRDFTRHELTGCLRETIACLPVYRTYVRPGDPVSTADRAHVEAALTEAGRRRPDLDPELLGFLGRILLLEEAGESAAELAARFQQTSGPVTAKGVEDTALYAHHRLVALNEIGGDPGRFGVTPEAFHAACARAAERWPQSMVTTSSHDTKRSEDVRARLAVLSEVPDRWAGAVGRWAAINERHRRDGAPDRGAEYLLYQTLVGAWPISAERAAAYMEKAAREAKRYTSWISPVPHYEEALRDFVLAVVADAEFVADLEAFLAEIVGAGQVNSLAMKLLCLTVPGVPDIYQGCELWDYSLVDPDNRRPVDFGRRSRLLEELDRLGDCAAETAWARRDEGLAKLLVVSRALRLRAELAETFAAGGYQPLPVTGQGAAHLVAFCRGGRAVTVVPRLVGAPPAGGRWPVKAGGPEGGSLGFPQALPHSLGEVAREGRRGVAGEAGPPPDDLGVELPEGTWTDRFTGVQHEGGAVVPATRLLARFPVALLARST